MKKNLLVFSTITGFVLLVVFASCKKGVKEPITLDRAAGKWSINAIRYQAYYNGSNTPADSTVPWRPVVENYVSFDGMTSFQYCFNTSYSTNGNYSFMGQDSISITMNEVTTKWKILLLTSTNFNIERELDNIHDFPGAEKVVMFQAFVR